MALWCFSEQSRNNTKIIICATRKASIVRLAAPCELAVQSPGHRTFLYMAVGCLSLIKTKLHILGMQWTSLNCLSVCDKQHLAWSVSIVCTFTLPRKWQSSWALQGGACNSQPYMGFWEGLSTTPCRTETILISPSCKYRVVPVSALPVGSALMAPNPQRRKYPGPWAVTPSSWHCCHLQCPYLGWQLVLPAAY